MGAVVLWAVAATATLGLGEAPKPPADSLAAVLPTAPPEQVGMSADRLQRIHGAIQPYIDDGRLAGVVTLVARRGRLVHFEAQGLADVGAKTPMRKDAIFRMASCSKPVTAVAVLMLMEEGKLRLDDPVSRFIPEFKNLKVAIAKPGGEVDLVPAARPITIHDLLTHTSGLGSGGAGAKATTKIMETREPGEKLADFIPRLGAAPLDFQPGSQFRYSGLAGFDTLGRVVEIASGQTYDEFLRSRVFEPLGMKDTFFVVPEDRRDRLASLYQGTPKGLVKLDTPGFLNSKTYFSGAGGLYSTAEDYARFAQMLLNGGQFGGRRLLSPRTVSLMASNHVGTLFGGQLGRPAPGRRLRAKRRGGVGRGSGRLAALQRQLRLGRRLRDDLLGRSEGAAHCRPAGAAQRPRRSPRLRERDHAGDC
jgi:CubicO group peptidase (beta-lactamase class C family)